MSETKRKGRVTIPTDVDVVPETLEILERWGADAIRDCDGTDYPEALKSEMCIRDRLSGRLYLRHDGRGRGTGVLQQGIAV